MGICRYQRAPAGIGRHLQGSGGGYLQAIGKVARGISTRCVVSGGTAWYLQELGFGRVSASIGEHAQVLGLSAGVWAYLQVFGHLQYREAFPGIGVISRIEGSPHVSGDCRHRARRTIAPSGKANRGRIG
jgi:hypothetical protein